MPNDAFGTSAAPTLAASAGRIRPWLRRAGLAVAALWIFGMGAAFFVRFTALVYADKREAIASLFRALQ